MYNQDYLTMVVVHLFLVLLINLHINMEVQQEVLGKVKVSGGGRCNVPHAEFDPGELVMNAANNGVLLTAAQQFSVGHPQRGLRLCFGAEKSTERLRHGVQIVERLLQTSEFGNTVVM